MTPLVVHATPQLQNIVDPVRCGYKAQGPHQARCFGECRGADKPFASGNGLLQFGTCLARLPKLISENRDLKNGRLWQRTTRRASDGRKRIEARR